ncbi:MAG: DUF1801 domain-containing protein [Kofleriaceae bacterium]
MSTPRSRPAAPRSRTPVKARLRVAASRTPVKAKLRVAASRTPVKAKLRAGAKKVVLLSGGNPQIAKGDGDAPVAAYLAALPGWKSPLATEVDALIVRVVPAVTKAVKWNSPFYGVDGQGWFLAMHAFTRFVRLTFFRGTSLRPPPPGPSKVAHTRYLDLYEGAPLPAELLSWIEQAAAIPGWMP